MGKKIVSYDQISSMQKFLDGKKSVLVGGCYDIIHFGHVMFLQAAKKEGNILIVALESDEAIKKKKQRDPIHTQKQRAFILSAFSFVDYVILLPYMENSRDYSEMVNLLKPAIIGVTEGDTKMHLKKNIADRFDITLKVVCPSLHNLSTSKIREYAYIFSN